MRQLLVLFFFLLSTLGFAQADSTWTDEKYLEDQLFLNLNYITLLETPKEISQSGFSFGLGGGFIKDLPVNKRRNVGIGIGLGYSFNNYYFDLRLESDNPEIPTEKINNKIILHNLEVPIELRFRGSTPTKYNFWRVYPGFKISYKFADNLQLGRNDLIDVNDVVSVNEWLYAFTLSAGYNKWNLYTYFGLNELFENNLPDQPQSPVKDFRIGLIFYVF